MINPEFGYWIAGLTDGEGSFALWFHDRRCEPTFTLTQRSDNLAILNEIRDKTGLGYVRTSKSYTQRNPMSAWIVRGVPDCLALISLFDSYPLRGTKAEVFTLWSIAVQTFLSRGLLPPKKLHEAIKARKHFRLYKVAQILPQRQFDHLIEAMNNDKLDHILENQINSLRRR